MLSISFFSKIRCKIGKTNVKSDFSAFLIIVFTPHDNKGNEEVSFMQEKAAMTDCHNYLTRK